MQKKVTAESSGHELQPHLAGTLGEWSINQKEMSHAPWI